ncbi:MAG: hypothetical protein H7301_02355 [Cryobacterium sp.]|nr:hypothetical protein [Oligoflexia bacterium]
MNNENGKTDHPVDGIENLAADQSEFDEKLDAVIEFLPESFRPMAHSSVEWIRDHPVEAALLGAAGGFTAGVIGISRVMIAARLMRSMPSIVPGVIAGVVTLAGALQGKNSDERVTH